MDKKGISNSPQSTDMIFHKKATMRIHWLFGIVLTCVFVFAMGCTSRAQGEADEEKPIATARPQYREVFSWKLSLPNNGFGLRFKHISLDKGLSQSSVISILQDSQGYLWFGTEDGLNRYDGYTFKVYKHDPQDPNSLSHNNIQSLSMDRDGNLLIGTNGGGLDKFDLRIEQFYHYKPIPGDPTSLSHSVVLSILRGEDGMIWVGTDGGGLNKFDYVTGVFTRYVNDPLDPYSLSNNTVQDIVQDEEGNLWIGTSNELNHFDVKEGKFKQFRHIPGYPNTPSGNNITALEIGADGKLWIGTSSGLDLYDPESNEFLHFKKDPTDSSSLVDNRVQTLYLDRSGALWVGTFGGGLDRLDIQSGKFMHSRNDPSRGTSLSNDFIYAVHEDFAGQFWIGTFGGGINVYDPRMDRFDHYYSTPFDERGLGYNIVFGMDEDLEGNIWLATFGGGMDRFNPATGQFAHFQNDPSNPASLSNNEVWSVYVDQGGDIWAGTNGGLNRLNYASGGFTTYYHSDLIPRSLSSNVVRAVIEDWVGNLWVGTDFGLNRFDGTTGQFNLYLHDESDNRSLSHNDIFCLFVDQDGFLWIGTSRGGLSRYNPETDGFDNFSHVEGDFTSLSHNGVLSIYQDSKGRFWVGTWGGGLNLYHPQDDTFTVYTQRDGLPNDVIYGILEDDQGFLWLSTNNGLSRFDPEELAFMNFTVEDGLQSNEFNLNAYLKTRDGKIYFGGINGFNSFYPREVFTNPHIPPIVISSVSIFNQVRHTYLQDSEEIQLSYQDNFLSFDFAALDFTSPESNQYAYMMEGLDKDWVIAGTRRHADYPNLRAGNYTFRVKGSNSDGVWNEEGTAVRITIQPPFWGTWWFRGLAVLLISGVAVGVYRLRIKGIEQRSRQLETVVEERTREIERRRQEIEALYHADEELYKNLELDQVLQTLVDTAVEILQADKGALMVWDEVRERLVPRAARGFNPETLAQVSILPGEGVAGVVAETGQPVIIEDTCSDARVTHAITDPEGICSFMQVPITVGGEVFGVFSADYMEPRQFSKDEQRLLTALAQRAAQAIENAQRFKEEQHRAEQFRVISDVGQRATSILTVDKLLIEMANLIQKGFDYDHVSFCLIEGDEVVSEARIASNNEVLEPQRVKLGQGCWGWVALHGRPLLIPDLSQEPRYLDDSMSGDVRSLLCVPLLIQEQVIGVLSAESHLLNTFDDSDIVVLQSLAHQAAIGIENARLFESAQQLAIVEERGRLARELHDSVSQALYGMTLYTQAAIGQLAMGNEDQTVGHLQDLQETAQEALAEMRLLIFELRPSVLAEEGLVTALQSRLMTVEERAGLDVDFDPQLRERLPANVETGLYRIAQEALNNVLKHANANEIMVYLRHTEDRITLEVCDDGIGYNPDIAREKGGMGLTAMQERAAELQGNFSIEGKTGEGTRVIVEVFL